MKIVRHVFETYLSVIEGSVGANMFRHVWADFDGERKDTMNDGGTSCAFYVSGILSMFNVIEKPSSTIQSVVNNMLTAGWHKVDEPEAGDILIWEPRVYPPVEEAQEHIGFYVGGDRAISTSWRTKTPIEHDWLCRDSEDRKVVAIYRGKHLMPDDIKTVEEDKK